MAKWAKYVPFVGRILATGAAALILTSEASPEQKAMALGGLIGSLVGAVHMTGYGAALGGMVGGPPGALVGGVIGIHPSEFKSFFKFYEKALIELCNTKPPDTDFFTEEIMGPTSSGEILDKTISSGISSVSRKISWSSWKISLAIPP